MKDFVTEHTASLRQQIALSQRWLAILSERLDKDHREVISWINVECITDAATTIAYEAGMLNGYHMARYDLPTAAPVVAP